MQKGFTLLELLVVIAIIGILSSIILVSYNGYTDKARIAKTLQWASSVNHSLGDRAVGAWTFDNIIGATVYDDSGNNNHGTAFGDPAVVNGVVGKALSFDGVDDYVDVGSINSVNGVSQLTISGWVKRNSGYGALFYKQSINVNTWIEVAWHPTVGLVFLTEGSLSNTYVTIPVGNDWKLITCVFDGTQAGNANRSKIYVNGVLQSVIYTGIISSVTSSPGGTAKIGRDMWNSATLNALIDDVRIFSAALTQAQIQQHYADGLKTHQNLAVY